MDLAIVVPTYNESANVPVLVSKLEPLFPGIDWEIIFVDDDSPDGTAREVARVAASHPRVRILRRVGRRGLSSACVEGMLSTTASYIAVMDADLQHDESILPRMFDKIRTGNLDLVVATRNAEGGGMGGFPERRVALSNLGRKLSSLVTRNHVSDPMSGFFIVTAGLVDEVVHNLSSVGFKILLDIVASAKRPLRIGEVPYTFRLRHAGESKLDINVNLEYLELLLDKLVGDVIPVRFALFVLVGALGVLVNLAVLGVAYGPLPFLSAQMLATLVAMTWNFALNNMVTFRDRRLRGSKLISGLFSYYVACSVGAFTNFAIADFIFSRGLHWLLAGFAGTAISSVWNFGVNEVFTWRRSKHRR